MNIGQAFAFISEDDEWMKKLGLGILVSLVPILNFAAMGYQVQISRNVVENEERPLPEWSNLGNFLLDGLRVFSAMFVYMLPLIFLYGLAAIFMVLTIDQSAATSAGTPPPLPPGFFALIGVSLLCGTPYMLFIWLIWPMLFIQVARKNSFTACFNFREMWQLIRQDWVNYLLVVGLYLGLTMGVSLIIMPVAIVLIFIPCLGMIATMTLQGAVMILVYAVSGHLQGQFIQLANTKPIPKIESTIP